MKLVFYSSTITMMHGPINIKCIKYLINIPGKHDIDERQKTTLPYTAQIFRKVLL